MGYTTSRSDSFRYTAGFTQETSVRATNLTKSGHSRRRDRIIGDPGPGCGRAECEQGVFRHPSAFRHPGIVAARCLQATAVGLARQPDQQRRCGGHQGPAISHSGEKPAGGTGALTRNDQRCRSPAKTEAADRADEKCAAKAHGQ